MVKTTSEDPTEKITKVTPLGAGSVDRKNAEFLMLAPRSGQSDSKNASNLSLARNRRDLETVPAIPRERSLGVLGIALTTMGAHSDAPPILHAAHVAQ
jgi:hypothetical protein